MQKKNYRNVVTQHNEILQIIGLENFSNYYVDPIGIRYFTEQFSIGVCIRAEYDFMYSRCDANLHKHRYLEQYELLKNKDSSFKLIQHHKNRKIIYENCYSLPKSDKFCMKKNYDCTSFKNIEDMLMRCNLKKKNRRVWSLSQKSEGYVVTLFFNLRDYKIIQLKKQKKKNIYEKIINELKNIPAPTSMKKFNLLTLHTN